MRRREFITLLGAALAWPLTGQAQQTAMPVIEFLRSAALADATHLITAFRQGLAVRFAIPAICEERQFAAAGGLMTLRRQFRAELSPGRNLHGPHSQRREARRPAGGAVDRFELVINLQPAKALGLEVPPGVSAQADEIIE